LRADPAQEIRSLENHCGAYLMSAEVCKEVLSEEIRSGVWQHYRTLEKYLVLGVGRHTETDEELVCYVPLYQHSNGGLPMQFRPVKMWRERVWHEKVEYPRFLYLGDRLDPKEQK
jgi:hypothetical protein